jgi:hypothetical protein
MFLTWRRERRIRSVLRKIARQRIALILQPGNVLVMELALQRNDDVEADLQTCLMRGWVEILHPSLPTGEITDDLRLPDGDMFTSRQTHYRLTEAGWAALNRDQAWKLVNTLIASASLLTALNLLFKG